MYQLRILSLKNALSFEIFVNKVIRKLLRIWYTVIYANNPELGSGSVSVLASDCGLWIGINMQCAFY